MCCGSPEGGRMFSGHHHHLMMMMTFDQQNTSLKKSMNIAIKIYVITQYNIDKKKGQPTSYIFKIDLVLQNIDELEHDVEPSAFSSLLISLYHSLYVPIYFLN
jgi:hypothetical protein